MKKNSADSRKARVMLTLSRVLVYALLIFLSILCLFSFYMLIINASRTNADLQGGFKALPQGHFLLLPDFYAVIRWVQKLPQILCVQKRSNALRLLICYLSVIIQVLFLSLILLYTRFCVIGRYLFQRLSY